ncbi:hypothetical protein ACFSKU_04935 [Pontibacter silvestris]|uniref:Uncharacterized protein n=1 Tax=Pontibacter silvestris TaxID=2305183 RepID=A0ABW4WU42_9BACT|nr:hypothetical protein [Pontibacter silvestris]MCC9136881.1 hypothetical protein [Pontibacter silvestris]
MKRFFKIKLRLVYSQAELWIAIKASSMGEAVVIADNRTMGTPFEICDNSVIEISLLEYNRMLSKVVLHNT